MSLAISTGLRWTRRGKLLLRPANGGAERRIEALIFDLGGTLDADGCSWGERFRRLLVEEKLPGAGAGRIDAALAAGERALLDHPRAALLGLAEMVGVHLQAQLAELDGAEPDRVHALAARFVRDTADTLQRRQNLLGRLAARLPLALVSNGCGNTRRLLAEHGLEGSFRHVVDSSEVGCWKPDPRIFEPVVHALGVTPGQIAVVGDRLDRDVAGARAAGLRALWVAGGRTLASGSARPSEVDATLRSVDQLEPQATA